jgi:hypothetical protein
MPQARPLGGGAHQAPVRLKLKTVKSWQSKELVYRALAFESVERVPYAIDFTVRAREKLCADAAGRVLYEGLRNDLLAAPVLRVEWGKRDAAGYYRDEYGLVWDRRIDALERNIREHPDRFQVLALDFSLFERAWGLRGLEAFLLDLLERPDFAGELLDRILQFNLQVIEAGLSACPQVDAVYSGDDFGSQAGILMGPELWRRMLKPRLARQYGAVKAAGKKVAIHSCGKVTEILDDLVEIGVDLFNPFQPEVMDVAELHRRYHGRLAFWGGISTQRLLPYATPAEVEAQVDRLLDMGRRGGFVIAPAHATPGDARVENMEAMLRRIIHQSSTH